MARANGLTCFLEHYRRGSSCCHLSPRDLLPLSNCVGTITSVGNGGVMLESAYARIELTTTNGVEIEGSPRTFIHGGQAFLGAASGAACLASNARAELVSKLPPRPAKPRSKVGRNERCSCGSGSKYKQCHGLPGRQSDATPR